MRDVDRRTIEAGMPGVILMENAGQRVVEFLAEKFHPLSGHRIAVLCGKGNNGGDGLVVARQLYTRFQPRSLHVLLAGDPAEMTGDAAANLRMLQLTGCPLVTEIDAEMQLATIVVDALLGTGLQGPAHGPMAGLIRQINDGFPLADVVSVDMPSGMQSDTGRVDGDVVTASYTVTFTGLKVCHALSPAAERCGRLRVSPIGSPEEMVDQDASIYLSLVQPGMFRQLFGPREIESNKGKYGHVLVLAGALGKTGAAGMTGLAALKAGAGLVTVASADSAIDLIAAHAPEIMTAPLPETESGSISTRAFDRGLLAGLAEKKTVIAIGPGLGTQIDTVQFVRRAIAELHLPMVVDADALNALDHEYKEVRSVRILTPHPGEMGRLVGRSIETIQADRVGIARAYAMERGVSLVLKGHRTVIAFPDGRVFINPTSSPPSPPAAPAIF